MISTIPVFHVISQFIFIIVASLLLIFEFFLLFATISHRNDTKFPVAYLIVMTICGIVCKIAFITDFTTYLFFPEDIYTEYRQFIGKEITLVGTLSYFVPMCVSVLMTLNRLFIVIKPTDQAIFSQKRIFVYSFGILIFCLTLLLIPYFSDCSVNFLASSLEFQTDCAPDKHPVTRFTNANAICIPTTLLLVNLVIIIHLKAVRHSTYTKLFQKTSAVGSKRTSQLARCQKRREHALMRQTLAITVYLSFYEVGSFLMRTFPIFYQNLPESIRSAYFYFRLETICAITFFVYFMESPSIRKTLLGRSDPKKNSGEQHGNPKISTITLRI
ncbi:Serpentine Receptor, class T [Caenorhabditis elegans]|uniref:Serpentine Receptor, class T n=1 Tax=Caenorhabditis elegans TaxID=6239 RepID=Q9U335_CAEEL|nr:Serpentine Receptor, class T [Caenorhabditis elegans]CAB60333.1 Serpentine Receptor, class T [Caenorhabditis elegans]|eukprot:NP_508005.1 Serpentine Receptor, class XA [Caenorhabditis elegans]